jgi:hypothetical protein
MKDRNPESGRGASEDTAAPRGPLAKLERRRIPPLKRSKMKLSSPAERQALAAFKAGKMKPLVRKTFPKEVVEERLGQFADHMIARLPKNGRANISRERLIDWLRPLVGPPQPLRDVGQTEITDGK